MKKDLEETSLEANNLVKKIMNLDGRTKYYLTVLSKVSGARDVVEDVYTAYGQAIVDHTMDSSLKGIETDTEVISAASLGRGIMQVYREYVESIESTREGTVKFPSMDRTLFYMFHGDVTLRISQDIQTLQGIDFGFSSPEELNKNVRQFYKDLFGPEYKNVLYDLGFIK